MEGLVAVLEGDKVLVQRAVEGCAVGCFAGYCCKFCVPACESICVLGGCRTRWHLACINRCHSVLYLGALEGLVAILEGDKVGIDDAVERSRIRSITCYRYNLCIPTLERIGILRISLLSRLFAVINRCHAVRYRFALEYFFAVLEGNEVLIDGAAERSRIGSIARNRYRCCIPTREGVGILRIGLLSRRLTIIGRHSTGHHFFGL